MPGTIKINGKEATGCAGGKLSVDTLTDAVLKETQRFTERAARAARKTFTGKRLYVTFRFSLSSFLFSSSLISLLKSLPTFDFGSISRNSI